MIRIHLVQMLYAPAYYHSPVDYLEEPSHADDLKKPLGFLRMAAQIQDVLRQNKEHYIDHIRAKVTAIIDWAAARSADLVVFPEYSIPHTLIPLLAELAQKAGAVIVAGTHRIPADNEARQEYALLGLDVTSLRIGKLNGIFAPVATGAPRRSPHRLDAAAPLGPAACACREAR